MMFDKKKLSTVIVAKMRDGKPEDEQKVQKSELGDEQDDSIAKEAVAEELLKAIEAKSPKAIAEAFSSMMELCSSEEESSEQPEQEESEQK